MKRVLRLVRWLSLTAIVAIVAACGASYRSNEGPCHVASREGGWHERLGFGWGDWGRSYGYATRLRVTERLADCEHTLAVEVDGRAWQSRAYGYVDHFVTDRRGGRFAFVGLDDRAYVVVDGAESDGWREVSWNPTFSPNGEHVAYLARDATGGVVVVDGRVAMRAVDFVPDDFELRDDGRFAAMRKRADGQVEVVFGELTSAPFQQICELSFAFGRSGRFAFVGQRGSRYTAVVDGKEIDAPGTPTNCDVVFSDDGARFAFVTVEPGAPDRFWLVVDGRVLDPGGHPSIARFDGRLLLVALDGQRERKLWLIDARTPPIAATADAYQPAFNGWTTPAPVRVLLGDSLGPAFDEVDARSFELAADGRVSYVGLRAGARITVIDNVIEAPPPATIAQ